ncbi:hypothetical protein [Leadbettera azotonutricia]|uniref:Band 7 domain-containing protein n=1 Tax=Leadbettera azotonutricia (strain ATCC BAA-888 / DSM 13862 / ZAS-9) TaxID=545695 RepID=F5YDH7_LEAAZ|nr:hypothetical protein [Leadbettera azotonutricia]AEF83029.1 conserved hypothetical protein [Leadbettera azotonutricia ZAS-9]
MKKFIAIVVILIILGGAGFFFGWAQLEVPPGSYGVIRSKLYGVDPQVIKEGEFRWVWFKLIPTNVDIQAYSLGRMSRDLKSSGTLPSGDVYADLAGLKADFSWEISGEFSFSLKPDILPSLLERENIQGQDSLEAYEKAYADKIEAFVLQRLQTYGRDEAKLAALLLSGSLPELDSAAQAAFPEIENFACLVRAARYPDYELYNAAKGLYGEYIARQQATLRDDVARGAEARMHARLRLDELAQYGELLTKYPILLQYLTLEKDVNPSPAGGGQ